MARLAPPLTQLLLTAALVLLASIYRVAGDVSSHSIISQALRRIKQDNSGSNIRKTKQRDLPIPTETFHVRTVKSYTGGPEALLQLYIALRRTKVNVYHAGIHDDHIKMYSELGLLTKEDVERYWEPNNYTGGKFEWTVIEPDVHDPCVKWPHLARWFIWLLGWNGRRECSYLSHSFYFARHLGFSIHSTMVPYMTPALWKHRAASAGIVPKEDLVIVDNDATDLSSALEPLKAQFPNLVVRVASGLPQAELFKLHAKAKAVIDARMVGLERLLFEGRIMNAVPIVEKSMVGSDLWDLDIPAEHTFAAGDHNALRKAVELALKCHECEIKKTETWVHRLYAGREAFDASVKRIFFSNAHFRVLHCPPGPEPAAAGAAGAGGSTANVPRNVSHPLLTAASILLSMPYASVEVLYPKGTASSDVMSGDMQNLLRANGLFYSMSLTEAELDPANAAGPRCTYKTDALPRPPHRDVVQTWGDVIVTSQSFQQRYMPFLRRSNVLMNKRLPLALLEGGAPEAGAAAGGTPNTPTGRQLGPPYLLFSMNQLADTPRDELYATYGLFDLCSQTHWRKMVTAVGAPSMLRSVCEGIIAAAGAGDGGVF